MPRGRKASPDTLPKWSLPYKPILLKQLTMECGITQKDFADTLAPRLGRRSLSRTSANLTINRGGIPVSIPNYKRTVEQMLLERETVRRWLADHGLSIADIWREAANPMRSNYPAGHAERSRVGTLAGMARTRNALVLRDPNSIHEEETSMQKLKIPRNILQKYKLFKSPFDDDPRNDKEVFRSEEHRYIEYVMLDAAQNNGFVAVIGEVGSGKTVMLRAVMDKLLTDDKVRIIFPQIMEKDRITSGSLCDAIIMDLGGASAKSPNKLEQKARKVKELLEAQAKADKNVVLIIEEVHDLNKPALKYLKRFNEMVLGFRKLLGVVLLGQTELNDILDESTNRDIREVIQRIQIARITGLGDNIHGYLKHRFAMVGADVDKIITREAVDALEKRLVDTDLRGDKVSQAYPLAVNNYMANAMIMAHEMGEEMVTADVIHAI